VGPDHRQIHQSLRSEPAWQTPLDRRDDDGRGDKGEPSSDAAGEALDDHIRMLLPLDLRADDTADALESDPVGELLSVLPQTLDSRLVRSISQASISGEDAVTLALGKRLEEVLSEEAQP
jgi:hypothetical protein